MIRLDSLYFQKISCPHIALLEDNVIFNYLYQFGTILLYASVLHRGQIVCIFTHILNMEHSADAAFIFFLLVSSANKLIYFP